MAPDSFSTTDLKFLLIGLFFGLINLFFLILIVKKLLSGQLSAFTILLIISKYSFLGIGLYFLVKNATNSLPWLIFGLSIFFISVIIYGFVVAKAQKGKADTNS